MRLRKVFRVASIFAVGTCAVAILKRTVDAVASGESIAFDEAVRSEFLSIQGSMEVMSDLVTVVSAPALLVTASLLIAYGLRRRGLGSWLPIAFAPVAAMTAGSIFSRTLPQQYAPDSNGYEPCFPSGHTTGMTAEAATIAYILARERLIGGGMSAVVAAAVAVAGLNRLYRDRHWATDIIAGWSGGIAVASGCALLREALTFDV